MKYLRKIPMPGFDTMGLSLVIWLCCLPLILLLVVPLWGIKVGLEMAILLLVILLLLCWLVCIPGTVKLYIREWQVYRLAQRLGRRKES